MQSPHLQRAQLLYQQHRYDLASDSLHQSLAEDPNDPLAHALLALCLLHQKKYDDATAEAAQAIHFGPDVSFAHYAMAFISHERNYFPEAEAAIREALRLAPDDPDYWALLAQTFLSRQRWKDALDAADHGLQADPEHLACTNLRAVALVKLGQKQAAVFAIGNALQRDPHNPTSHANQGWTYLHQNDPKKALEHFREALRLDPNNAWAREGTMAALKARHLLYRIMLRYYLWMAKFNARGQWGIIIGIWVAIQILHAINANNPGLAPFIFPILVAYVLFAFASWLANPIFDLTLLLNPFGRYLLSRTKTIAALLVGLFLLAGISVAIIAFLSSNDDLFIPAILLAILTLPIAATSKCRGQHLLLMSLYTTATIITAGTAIVLTLLDHPLAFNFTLTALYASLLSGLAANLLLSIVRKK